MLDSELQGLCLYWQEQLRLQDWDITAKFGIPIGASDACVNPSENGMCAEIIVMSTLNQKARHTKLIGEPDGVEIDLVHELLEIMFNALRREVDMDCKDYRFEQNYNKLARALVKLKYSKEQ